MTYYHMIQDNILILLYINSFTLGEECSLNNGLWTSYKQNDGLKKLTTNYSYYPEIF